MFSRTDAPAGRGIAIALLAISSILLILEACEEPRSREQPAAEPELVTIYDEPASGEIRVECPECGEPAEWRDGCIVCGNQACGLYGLRVIIEG